MANVSVGNFVNQATGTLATIVSQDPIYVLFPASTQQVLDYRQRAAKTPGATPGRLSARTGPARPDSAVQR